MRIYLDVCCLNRPFDDLRIDRTRLESEAVVTIMNQILDKDWLLLGSEVAEIEISRIPDEGRRQRVSVLYSTARNNITIDPDVERRSIELERRGFKPFDALHISCAEKGKVDIFLTTDDDLLRKASQNRNILKVRLENPVKWLMEVFER